MRLKDKLVHARPMVRRSRLALKLPPPQRKPFAFGLLAGGVLACCLQSVAHWWRLVHLEEHDIHLLGHSHWEMAQRRQHHELPREPIDPNQGFSDIGDDQLVANLEHVRTGREADLSHHQEKREGNQAARLPVGVDKSLAAKQIETARRVREARRRRERAARRQVTRTAKPKDTTFDSRKKLHKDAGPPVHDDAQVIEVPYQDIDTLDMDLFGLGEFCRKQKNKLVVPKSYKVCLQGKLPPFSHPKPLFLPGDDESIWMMQPENLVAIEPDWVNWSWQTCVTIRKGATNIHGKLEVGGMDSFQHFHDNALGMIYQTRQAFDLIHKSAGDCDLTESLFSKRGKGVIRDEWEILGFPNDLLLPGTERNAEVEITYYPQDFDQVRVHPIHVQWLRSKFEDDPPIKRDKVIWISRQGANKKANGRQMVDEQATLRRLKKLLSSLRRYHPKEANAQSVRQLRSAFADACMIVGLHGGHMYNQFFASTQTTVVELVAVEEGGLFHGQKTPEIRPQLSHRAMWQNANLIGQKYWRVHFVSEKGTDFEFEDATLEKVAEIARLSGCVTDGETAIQ